MFIKKKQKILIAFNDKVADILSHQKKSANGNIIFVRSITLSIPLIFITECYLLTPKIKNIN